MKKEVQKGSSCPHKGEFPQRESIFFPSRKFTWCLIGFDADTLCVECEECGWHQLNHNIDRLSFFWDVESYLPEHP